MNTKNKQYYQVKGKTSYFSDATKRRKIYFSAATKSWSVCAKIWTKIMHDAKNDAKMTQITRMTLIWRKWRKIRISDACVI